MAVDNRTLGRFDLVGIPPAPRGIPQIEVTFDIDANGIVHVSAKDLGTGKEQKIKIEVSSGLTEQEIQRMVNDAATHEGEDKTKKELIQARNEADQLVYAMEKTLKEQADKVSESSRKTVEAAIEKVKSVLNSDNAQTIRSAMEELTQASHAVAAEMYRQTGQAGATGTAENMSDSAGTSDSTGSTARPKDGAVDADFEVVDDDEKK